MSFDFINIIANIFRQVLPIASRFIISAIFFTLCFLLLFYLKLILVRILKITRIEKLLDSMGLKKPLTISGLNKDFGEMLVEIIFWISLTVAFMISLYIVYGDQVLGTSASVINYYLNDFSLSVFTSIFILLVGILFAQFISYFVRLFMSMFQLPYSELVVQFARWSILINAVLRALYNVGLIESLSLAIDALGIALVSAVALSLALGSQSYFPAIVQKVFQKLQSQPDLSKLFERKPRVKKVVKPKKKKISLTQKVKLPNDFLSAEVQKEIRMRR